MNPLEARRRLLGRNVYKRTTEGNPAIAQGSLARMYPGITMQGWTEQESTTGANLIDYTQAIPRNKNQSVEIIDGGVKWTGDYYFIIPVAGLKKNQNYIMSYESDDAGYWAFSYSDSTFSLGVNNGQSNTTNPEKDCSAVFIYKSDPVVAGQDMVFTNIMLNEGTTALPYEPYTGGAPSPSPDYPQEIVSAGDYNQETGKWEYEITIANAQTDPDKNQSVTLTADRPLTKWDKLEKRNGQWGWVYKSAEVVLDGSEKWSLYFSGTVFLTDLPNASLGLQTSLCDKYRNIDYAWDAYYNEVFGIYSDNETTTNKYFRPPSADVETVEQWKTWLQSNPLTLWYETDTETFAPLSESEQEALNALYTFRPTTVLSNQQDCDMTLTYKTRKGMS